MLMFRIPFPYRAFIAQCHILHSVYGYWIFSIYYLYNFWAADLKTGEFRRNIRGLQSTRTEISIIQMITCRNLLEGTLLIFWPRRAFFVNVCYCVCYLCDFLDEEVTNLSCHGNVQTPLLRHPACSHKYIPHIQVAQNSIMTKRKITHDTC